MQLGKPCDLHWITVSNTRCRGSDIQFFVEFPTLCKNIFFLEFQNVQNFFLYRWFKMLLAGAKVRDVSGLVNQFVLFILYLNFMFLYCFNAGSKEQVNQ